MTHWSEEERACPTTQGHVEKHQSQAGGRRSKEKHEQKPFFMVCVEGMSKAGKAADGA